MNFLTRRVEKVSPPPALFEPKIIGHVDIYGNGRIKGWAVDLNDSKSVLYVDLFFAGDFICTHDAGLERPDLESLGVGHVRHGFDFECGLPSRAMNGVAVIARRKDRKTTRSTTNLATQFIAVHSTGGLPSSDEAAAEAGDPPRQLRPILDIRTSVGADRLGLDINSTLQIALTRPPIVVVMPFAAAAPTFALPTAATVNVPADSSQGTLERIRQLEPEQSCIVIDQLLQHGLDYRLILAAAFDRLAVGGFLIAVVPSQILYERKLQLPSRLPSAFRKFYTPSLLLAEMEEAVDPFLFRLRFAGDLDADYAADILDRPPDGRSDIIMVVEKAVVPQWLDRLKSEDTPARYFPVPTERLKPEPTSPYVVVAPDGGGLRQILVLQLDHRGDFVMGADARQLLRTLWPGAAITLVCGSWNKGEALAAKIADTILTFDFFAEDVSAGGRAVSLDEHNAAFRGLLGGRVFDLAVDLRLSSDTRHFLRHATARIKAGFDTGDEFPWLDIRMPAINPERASKAWQRFLPAAAFHTCGDHNYLEIKLAPDDCARVNGRTVIWGPYIDLPMGDYEIILKCVSAVPTVLVYDICVDQGEAIIGGGNLDIGASSDQTIHLRLPNPVKFFELRIYAIPGRPYPPLTFVGLHVIKRPSLVGLHQRENMNLLAHLVALRNEHPTLSERVSRHAQG